MSIFDLKGGASNGWNYSDKNKPGYMNSITGTVVEISNPQALNFSTKQPEFWKDGNPKRNLCVTIKGQSGRELNWTFAPRGHGSQACLTALDPQGIRPAVNIEELLGKMITVTTQEGVYNAQNPRPWHVQILGQGDVASVRGIVDLEKPQAQQPMAQPQPQPQSQPPMPQAQPVPQQYPDTAYADEDIPF